MVALLYVQRMVFVCFPFGSPEMTHDPKTWQFEPIILGNMTVDSLYIHVLLALASLHQTVVVRE